MHNNDFGLWVKGNTSREAYANCLIICLLTDGIVVTQTCAHTNLSTGKVPGDNTHTHTLTNTRNWALKYCFPKLSDSPQALICTIKAPPKHILLRCSSITHLVLISICFVFSKPKLMTTISPEVAHSLSLPPSSNHPQLN